MLHVQDNSSNYLIYKNQNSEVDKFEFLHMNSQATNLHPKDISVKNGEFLLPMANLFSQK